MYTCISLYPLGTDEEADNNMFPATFTDKDRDHCILIKQEDKMIATDPESPPYFKSSLSTHDKLFNHTDAAMALNIGDTMTTNSAVTHVNTINSGSVMLSGSGGQHPGLTKSQPSPLIKCVKGNNPITLSYIANISHPVTVYSPNGSPEHVRPSIITSICNSGLNLSTSSLLDTTPVSPLLSPPTNMSHPCLEIPLDAVLHVSRICHFIDIKHSGASFIQTPLFARCVSI